MQDELKTAEASGRGGDSFLGHLSPGDTVIPRGMMQPEWREFLQNHFDVDTYTVGNEKNSLNPFTGLPEFRDGADSSGYGSANDAFGGGYGSSGAATGGGYGSTGDAFGSGYGMGAAPTGGIMGSIGSGLASIGTSIGQAIGGYFGDKNAGASGPVGAVGVDGGSMSGGDNAPSVYANPLQAAAAQVASPSVSSMAPLPNPMTPNVPDTVPQLGEYYNLLRQGNTAGAENMLSRFMRGDSNVYGR